jgi:hypothetical protein
MGGAGCVWGSRTSPPTGPEPAEPVPSYSGGGAWSRLGVRPWRRRIRCGAAQGDAVRARSVILSVISRGAGAGPPGPVQGGEQRAELAGPVKPLARNGHASLGRRVIENSGNPARLRHDGRSTRSEHGPPCAHSSRAVVAQPRAGAPAVGAAARRAANGFSAQRVARPALLLPSARLRLRRCFAGYRQGRLVGYLGVAVRLE